MSEISEEQESFSENEKLIHHEGWLEKKSPSQVKGWQKRWVVLHGSMLRYWRDVADYHAEKSPSGVIHAHTVLSIDADAESDIGLNIKVLKSRVDIRKYEWRMWCPNESASKRKRLKKKGGGAEARMSEAELARAEWINTFDEWCERYLVERLFSRFHVRKPARFLDEIMGMEPPQDGADAAGSDGSTAQSHRASTLHRKASTRMGLRSAHNLESHLDKRSPGLFALWQRRWFVLLEEEDVIVYYKSRDEYVSGSEPVGSFQIADLNTVQPVGGPNGREMHIETLSVPGAGQARSGSGSKKKQSAAGAEGIAVRTYKLRALNTDVRDQWVQQLKARIGVKSKAGVARRMQQARSSISEQPAAALSPHSVSAAVTPTAGSPAMAAAASPGSSARPMLTHARSLPVRGRVGVAGNVTASAAGGGSHRGSGSATPSTAADARANDDHGIGLGFVDDENSRSDVGVREGALTSGPGRPPHSAMASFAASSPAHSSLPPFSLAADDIKLAIR